MKDTHIISLLEESPLAGLSDTDLASIRAHTADCADCQRAFEAAQISTLLLKERVAESFEPSPFFHTRVMAQLREKQIGRASWSWARMWRAAGALASTMALTVAALAVLTASLPESETAMGVETTAVNAYSPEELILSQDELFEGQLTDGHVLTTLYDAEEDTER